MIGADDKKPVRERILEIAAEMFYRDGIRAVGIDAIIVRSGVAKMSLYRNFPSKDALVTAWLEDRNQAFGSAGIGSRRAAPATRGRN